MQRTSDINVVETRRLPSPTELLALSPKSEAQAEFVARARQEARETMEQVRSAMGVKSIVEPA